MDDGLADFERWYETEHARLVRSLSVAVPSDIARDCADEASSRAYAKWDRVSTMGNPSGWTYRVAVNVFRRRMRRRAIEQRLLSRYRADATVEPLIPDLDLWRAVRELPKRQRLAVGLRYAGGLTEAQIAEAMGIRPGTVAATLSKARGRLAEQLADDSDDDIEVTVWQT